MWHIPIYTYLRMLEPDIFYTYIYRCFIFMMPLHITKNLLFMCCCAHRVIILKVICCPANRGVKRHDSLGYILTHTFTIICKLISQWKILKYMNGWKFWKGKNEAEEHLKSHRFIIRLFLDKFQMKIKS